MDAGIAHGFSARYAHQAYILVSCPAGNDHRIVDAFEIATVTSDDPRTPEVGDVEAERGRLFADPQWPRTTPLQMCDVRFVASEPQPGFEDTRAAWSPVLFGRACWRDGKLEDAQCPSAPELAPRQEFVGASSRDPKPFEVDLILQGFELVAEVRARTPSHFATVKASGHCTTDAGEVEITGSIDDVRIQWLERGETVRESPRSFDTVPRECRVRFTAARGHSPPVELTTISLPR